MFSITLTCHDTTAHPTFIVRPTASESVEASGDITFECKASGNPTPTLFWSIVGNRTLLFAGSHAEPNVDVSFGNGVATNNPASLDRGLIVLTIRAARSSQNGMIVVCTALNAVGSVSVRSKLTVRLPEDRPPPVIAIGPVNQTLPIKSVAVLNCQAAGVPTPVISWYRDGIPVVQTPKINMTDAGELTILDLDKDRDQGLYTCVASSRSGKSTWSGFLRLEQPTNPNIRFFRAPDASKIPSAPLKPLVTNVTDDSITIAWQPVVVVVPPATSKPNVNNAVMDVNDGSDIGGTTAPNEMLGYSIEVFSHNMSKSWIEVASRVVGTTWTQRDLLKGATYTFFVRAENSQGISAPSPMTDPTVVGGVGGRQQKQQQQQQSTLSSTQQQQPQKQPEDLTLNEAFAALSAAGDDVVQLLEANATDTTSVRLLWTILNGRYVEGFYIYSRNTNNGSVRVLTVLHGGGATACTVSALAMYTEYEFFLVPFYKSVEGRPSNSRHARTLESGMYCIDE